MASEAKCPNCGFIRVGPLAFEDAATLREFQEAEEKPYWDDVIRQKSDTIEKLAGLLREVPGEDDPDKQNDWWCSISGLTDWLARRDAALSALQTQGDGTQQAEEKVR